MAKLRFEIEGSPSSVAFSTYIAATTGLMKLLRELDTILSSTYHGSLKWYVSHLESAGNLTLDVVSRVRPLKHAPADVGTRVTSSLVQGFDNIQHKGISPPFLSYYGLKNLGDMLDVLNRNGASGYTATAVDEGNSTTVSPNAADTIRQLLPIKRSAIGSVEGMLEAISIRGGGKFIVYDSLTDKAIACRFDNADLERVKSLLGRRVLVSGIVHANIKSEPIRVDVETVRTLGDGLLPKTAELAGGYPSITEGMTLDDYLRSIRGD